MSTTAWFAPLLRPAPADLEQWLEAKAADGRLLNGFSRLSPLRMSFTQSAPATVRYAIERRRRPVSIDYYRFREADGWQHVGNAGDLHLWRREYTGERPAGFIGDDLGRRTSLLGMGLAVVAAITLIAAVALGATAALVATPSALWAPAVVFGVIGLGAALASMAIAVSDRNARTTTTPAPTKRSPSTVDA